MICALHFRLEQIQSGGGANLKESSPDFGRGSTAASAGSAKIPLDTPHRTFSNRPVGCRHTGRERDQDELVSCKRLVREILTPGL